MKYTFAMIILLLSSTAIASMIGKIDLSKLENKSELIVLAKVINIVSDSALDKVTIKVSSILKGKLDNKEITILLQVRGGLKEFDPEIQVGDFGVFFLKKGSNYYRTAHGGSIAIFEKNHFEQ